MNLTTLFASLATGMGTLFAISPALQIRRMRMAKSSANISLGFMVISIGNFAIWATYGYLIGSFPLLAPNVLAFTIASANLLTALYYRPRAAARKPSMVEKTALVTP